MKKVQFSSDPLHQYTQQNRRAWNEIARGGPEWRYGALKKAANRLPGEFLILARKE